MLYTTLAKTPTSHLGRGEISPLLVDARKRNPLCPARLISMESSLETTFGANALFAGFTSFSAPPFENGERLITAAAAKRWAEEIASHFQTLSVVSVAASTGKRPFSISSKVAEDLALLEQALLDNLRSENSYIPGLVFDFGVVGDRPYLTGIPTSKPLIEWHERNRAWFDGLVMFRLALEVPSVDAVFSFP